MGIPNERDWLVAYSTLEGFMLAANTGSGEGSYFFSELITVIQLWRKVHDLKRCLP